MNVGNDLNRTYEASLTTLLWVVVKATFVSLLLGPWVYNVLGHLGRGLSFLSPLRNVDFVSCQSRVLLIVLLMMLLRNYRSFRGIWEPMRELDKRQLMRWWFIGVLGIALLVFLSTWVTDSGYNFRHISLPILLTAFIGGILVGYIEEYLFRGILFKGLREKTGFLGAMLVSSVIFSSVHFLKPYPELDIVYARWYDGFALLSHTFHTGHALNHYFPFALTLFLMGATLCVFVQKGYPVSVAAALHAGWVFGLQGIGEGIVVSEKTDHFWFFPAAELEKTYAALVLMILMLFIIAGLKTPKR